MTRAGDSTLYSNAGMRFTYRHTGVPDDVIFTEALFEGRPGNPDEILAEMNAITEARSSTQPVNTRTGGSTFKNPPGKKAWELVDAAGCRGLRMGDAQSRPELHALAFVSVPHAMVDQLIRHTRRDLLAALPRDHR